MVVVGLLFHLVKSFITKNRRLFERLAVGLLKELGI